MYPIGEVGQQQNYTKFKNYELEAQIRSSDDESSDNSDIERPRTLYQTCYGTSLTEKNSKKEQDLSTNTYDQLTKDSALTRSQYKQHVNVSIWVGVLTAVLEYLILQLFTLHSILFTF